MAEQDLINKTEAIELGINQVEYSNTPDGPVVHIFGRTPDGTYAEVRVTGFKPYFYALQVEADNPPDYSIVTIDKSKIYHSIHGEALRRLYTVRPTDVRHERDRYHHFEADIPFATRFMIDTGITGGVRTPGLTVDYKELIPETVNAKSRICMIDIECEDVRGFPEPETDKVTCITCWDSFDNEYTTILLKPEGNNPAWDEFYNNRETIVPEEKGPVIFCSTEQELFRELISFMQKYNPDIISGWNISEFDIPYIIKRMQKLSISPESLARLEQTGERNPIRGRSVFDLLTAYKKIHSAQKESYRLDAVAQAELGETKVRFKGTLSQLWHENPELMVRYNRKDVSLCVGIDAKDAIINFYQEIARYVGCPLDTTMNSSNIVDIYVLRKASGQYILPSKGFAASEEFEGATVFEPSLGTRANVVVLDLKSLYPMAMMTLNASPETKDPDGEIKAPNGIRFKKSPDGLTRSIIRDLLKERDEKKDERNKHPFGSREYQILDLQQNVLKVIMNTYYGVSGYARFRLYDREIGSAVTSVGRAIIEHTRKIIENEGYRVIYGDTDSCMVSLPDGPLNKTIETARSIETSLNESYNSFSKEVLNAQTHFFSIKFEKVYRRFFQAGKKKRYAGHLIWKEGKDVDEIDVVGFEIRRSDYPFITKVVQQQVINQILKGSGYSEVKEYLRDIITSYRSGKYSYDEIGIPGGIGKKLTDYENDDAHIRGAKYANKHLGMEFSKGSKPKRLYIKNVKSKYPKTDVVCFEYGDQVPPEFVVDYEVMLEKTIKLPISRIVEALGYKWTDFDPTRTTLAQFGL